MKGVSFIVAIVVLVLWLGSATYIAAPSSIVQKLPTMGSVPSGFLGVLLFLLSIVVITLWAGMSSEDADAEKTTTPAIKE